LDECNELLKNDLDLEIGGVYFYIHLDHDQRSPLVAPHSLRKHNAKLDPSSCDPQTLQFADHDLLSRKNSCILQK
jgi:hypothetical protein